MPEVLLELNSFRVPAIWILFFWKCHYFSWVFWFARPSCCIPRMPWSSGIVDAWVGGSDWTRAVCQPEYLLTISE